MTRDDLGKLIRGAFLQADAELRPGRAAECPLVPWERVDELTRESYRRAAEHFRSSLGVDRLSAERDGLLARAVGQWPGGGWVASLPWREGGYPGGTWDQGMGWWFQERSEAESAVLSTIDAMSH